MLRTIRRSIQRKGNVNKLRRETHLSAGIPPRNQRRYNAKQTGNTFAPQYDVRDAYAPRTIAEVAE